MTQKPSVYDAYIAEVDALSISARSASGLIPGVGILLAVYRVGSNPSVKSTRLRSSVIPKTFLTLSIMARPGPRSCLRRRQSSLPPCH